jgi:hypothetical protein
MAAYRFADQNPVFFNLLGLARAANGSVRFYERGTTTPKDTYSLPNLLVANPNPVPLDSDGRANVEVWLDGEYTAVLMDEDDSVIWTRDIFPAVEAGNELPDMTGKDGYFLATDGEMAVWLEIRQLPDPTDSAGYMVVVNGDGTGYILVAPPGEPEPPADPDVTVGAASFRAGISTDETKFLIQRGTGSAAATGTVNTSVAVVFDTEYDDTPTVHVTPTSDSNAGGPMVPELSAISSTGFTVLFTIAAGDLANAKVLNAVPFCWTAFGNIEVPAEP